MGRNIAFGSRNDFSAAPVSQCCIVLKHFLNRLQHDLPQLVYISCIIQIAVRTAEKRAGVWQLQMGADRVFEVIQQLFAEKIGKGGVQARCTRLCRTAVNQVLTERAVQRFDRITEAVPYRRR